MTKEKKLPKVQDDIPYVTKILSEKLDYEQRFLKIIEKNISSSDPLTARQANGNLNSCKERIIQLEESLEFLKAYRKPFKEKN